MRLILRPATPADAYPLWLWANDPVSRMASGDRAVIDWPDHARWLAGRLASDSAVVLIAESADGRPVGTVRFETESGWTRARLSYTVAPESRHQGVGRLVLEDGLVAFRGRHREAVVEALVRLANDPSLRLFRRLGWRELPVEAGLIRFECGPEEIPCRP